MSFYAIIVNLLSRKFPRFIKKIELGIARERKEGREVSGYLLFSKISAVDTFDFDV